MYLLIHHKNFQLNFYSIQNNSIKKNYSLKIHTKLKKFYIDQDNIIYGYDNHNLYKINDNLIPLVENLSFVRFGENIFFVKNGCVFKVNSESNYQKIIDLNLKEVDNDNEEDVDNGSNKNINANINKRIINKNMNNSIENKNMNYFIKDILENDNFIFLIKNLEILIFLKSGKFIKKIITKFEIKKIFIKKEKIYLISKSNIFYSFINNNFEEIINLQNYKIISYNLNNFLEVFVFSTLKNIFIVDIENKKIIKNINFFNSKKVFFKNKRELILICENKIFEYHLGRDKLNLILEDEIENDESSVFYFKEIKNEKIFDGNDFKEEIRTKLIENKIENKRNIFFLMNEIEELKKKIN